MARKIFYKYLLISYFVIIAYYILTIFLWEKTNKFFLILLLQFFVVLIGTYVFKFSEKLRDNKGKQDLQVIFSEDLSIKEKFTPSLSGIIIFMICLIVISFIITSGILITLDGSPVIVDGAYFLNDRGNYTEITYELYVTYRTISTLNFTSVVLFVIQGAIIVLKEHIYLNGDIENS